MEDLDVLVPHFRRTKERWPEAPTLSSHYKAVRKNYEGDKHGLVATIKSFIECACLTILGEFGKTMPSSDPSTTELLVEALKPLGLQNSRGASRVDKLLSAHNKLADALTEIRNENDPVAHGKDGFVDSLTSNELRAFLITADTILALLLCAHDGTEPDLQFTREPYERFTHLHERVDRSVAVEAAIEDDDERQVVVIKLRTGNLQEGVELRIEPSRLLYAIDRTAYVEFLASSSLETQPATVLPVISEKKTTESIPFLRPSESPPPAAAVVSFYRGGLLPLKKALARYLKSFGLLAVEAHSGGNFLDSILATDERHMGLDWSERESLQAAMKVALRRTLVKFGIDQELAEQGAGQIISWLKIQTAGLTTKEPT
ncbi:MAG: abortive infection family protein [Elusimicrobia bacterium]|nr:abortive infection family protein [Elusimicrobiota bacterium]